MAIDKHTMQVVDGSSAIFTDRTIVGVLTGVVSTTGVNQVTAVTFAEPLPATYAVFVMPNQNLTAFVTAKTSTGFNVTLQGTAAGGITFDVLVVA
jgi:hypothetical protein